MRAACVMIVLAAIAGCDHGGRVANDASAAHDGGLATDGDLARDAGRPIDVGPGIDGALAHDTGTGVDAGHGADADLGSDTGSSVDDAFVSLDAGHDAFASPDAFVASGGCVSGALGTRAVRFRWRGNGAGSTAYVDYELNQLPDTSRWHVSSASMSFSYVPTFDDPFLGEGGLDLEGTAFIDVELSTASLSVSRATIAIYGRSFDTTASGSFHWQTFHGTGDSDLVANSAPYEWYLADATTELPGGDGNTLLRIYAGPPSDALIVSRVEICFAE